MAVDECLVERGFDVGSGCDALGGFRVAGEQAVVADGYVAFAGGGEDFIDGVAEGMVLAGPVELCARSQLVEAAFVAKEGCSFPPTGRCGCWSGRSR